MSSSSEGRVSWRIEGSRKCLEDFLVETVQRGGNFKEGRENLDQLISTLARACKAISWEIDAEPLKLADEEESKNSSSADASVNASGDEQKELDVRANNIFLEALQQCPSCALAASEEETETIELNTATNDGLKDKYAVVFDPIDGSRNIECNIPTGTIFGVYKHSASKGVMQSGDNLVAAGYTLYSSSTILVLTLGEGTGTHGFTLDRKTGDFILTHPNMQIPSRGQIYSLNDARYFDWPQGLREYIDTVRRGAGETGEQYSARYVCSLVADVHRTLLYGGVAMNPRFHLRLLYEGAPMAKVLEQAGGQGMDGITSLLSIVPQELHQKTPVFLGSPEDMSELLSFSSKGIRQTSQKKYIGSLVGDFHRTLLYGGVFGYPGDSNNKNGKLRLLYECAPISFLAEQAGGKGSTGTGRILDLVPGEVHQKCPIFIGSEKDVEAIERFLEKDQLGKELAQAKMERMYKIKEATYRAPIDPV